MATRDLTQVYIRTHSAFHRRRGPESTSLTAAVGDVHIDVGSLTGPAPVYVELVNDINADINAIHAKMGDLEKAHESRLRITFDPDAENRKEHEIEIMTAELTRMFNLAGLKIQRLAKQTVTEQDAKLRANIQRGLATRLHGLSQDFRNSQKNYLGQLQRLRANAGFGNLLGADAAAAVDRDEGFTDAQLAELANAEEDVDERMREIQRIAKSVEELANMFKELAVLIVEQGTILDRIDHNMEEAVSATAKGVKELQKAEEYQKSARPIKCMLVLMVLIIVCVIIIIVKTAN